MRINFPLNIRSPVRKEKLQRISKHILPIFDVVVCNAKCGTVYSCVYRCFLSSFSLFPFSLAGEVQDERCDT